MSNSTRPSLSRLKVLLARQDPPTFGEGYIPAILATREEAPSSSRYAQYFDRRLGRAVHFLSQQEQKVGLILLYFPTLFELQEQRVIHFDSRPHPLDGHPRAGRTRFQPLRGACEVAESLGVLKHYPVIRFSQGGVCLRLPYVLVGDLLGFFMGARGPYCVNLNIKATREDFHRPTPWTRLSVDQSTSYEKVAARHLIERVRYEEAGIRTVEVAAQEQVDDALFANLRSIFLWQKRRCNLPEQLQREIIDEFRSGALTGLSALDVMKRLVGRQNRLQIEELKRVFFQAIWRRKLRLDLFQPVLVDEAMQPEKRDLLEVYADWIEQR